MTREEVFKTIGADDTSNAPFDDYEFCGIFHPNYNCDNIAFIDDLNRYLNGQYDPNDPYDNGTRMSKIFPDEYDAEVECLRLYCQEMLQAVEVYQSMRYPEGRPSY